MTTTETDEVARKILATLETAFATSDVDLVSNLFADDVLFLGGAATAHGAAHARAYTEASIKHIERMVWDADQCWTIEPGEGSLVVVATGEMHMRNGRSSPYRATLVLERHDVEWRIRHFHGSAPAD